MPQLSAGRTGKPLSGAKNRMQKIFNTSGRCLDRPVLRKMSGNRRKPFCAQVLTMAAGCGSPGAREQREKSRADLTAEKLPTRSDAWIIRKKETSASFRSAVL